MGRYRTKGNKLITLYLPETWVKILDELVKKGIYKSRAEAIRTAIKDSINLELKPITEKIERID